MGLSESEELAKVELQVSIMIGVCFVFDLFLFLSEVWEEIIATLSGIEIIFIFDFDFDWLMKGLSQSESDSVTVSLSD